MAGKRSFLTLTRTSYCLGLVLVLVASSCKNSGRIQVIEEHQGKAVFSNYAFAYEDMAHPKIVQLFQQERLERFIRQYKTQWERQVALCDWTNSQFPPGTPDPYPLSNGLDILRDIRAGKTKGFCGQYAYLLADALKSLGYFPVRYVELESKNHQFHFNVEVWNDDWQKWVILDPFYNVYYTGGKDIPLSAMELHELNVEGKSHTAKIRPIQKRDYQPAPEKSTEFYHSIAISLRNDFAGLPRPLSVNDRFRTFLQYQDPGLKDWKSKLGYVQRSSRKDDFNYRCNQVWIRFEMNPERDLLQCLFETRGTTPHFRRFVVSIDQGEWIESQDQFDWKLQRGEHSLQVSAINQFHLFSNAAVLRVIVK